MPYWRLSLFYFFYFSSLGALIPFWGLYLKDRGLSPAAIGELLAILMATKILAPNLWGWIADHTDARLVIVRVASLLSPMAFALVYTADGFWGMALAMALFSFFWNASLPQMEAITFNHLGPMVRRYATIRLWGSIGFILSVLALGAVVERVGTAVVPDLVLVLFVGIWLSSLAVPDAGQSRPEQQFVSVTRLLARPEVIALLAACFLMQASHGAFYAFYSIYLTEAGYSSQSVGALWAWGVAVEVIAFARMHWLLERFGARDLLLASLALAVLRWCLTAAWPANPLIQVFAQTLHAATFGTFHASAIYLVHHYFSGRTQGRGQALYSSLSFGAGGALGSLLSGLLFSSAGAAATFGLSAAMAAMGWAAVWLWVDRGGRY